MTLCDNDPTIRYQSPWDSSAFQLGHTACNGGTQEAEAEY